MIMLSDVRIVYSISYDVKIDDLIYFVFLPSTRTHIPNYTRLTSNNLVCLHMQVCLYHKRTRSTLSYNKENLHITHQINLSCTSFRPHLCIEVCLQQMALMMIQNSRAKYTSIKTREYCPKLGVGEENGVQLQFGKI